MAAFNHAQYIDAAINSALAQTWQDFELIVVDDGSTDTTAQVVSQFGDRVRYIYQDNRRQGAARNRGIAEARGSYICFLDDDDVWEPEYLATVMSVFQRLPDTDALHTGFRIIDTEGKVLPQQGSRVVPPEQMYEALIIGGWFPPVVVTVQKTCLDEVGPLDETLHGHDDWDLWLRIARDHVFRGIPNPLARYRTHAGGLSANHEHMLLDQKRAIVKHFGPEEGNPTSWPTNRRRAYGAAYSSAALSCVQAGDSSRGRLLLKHAIEINPEILCRLDTFYELALGDQQRGHRGEVRGQELATNGSTMLHWLADLFATTGEPLATFRGQAYSNAYLALGMLADQAEEWTSARSYLIRAVLSSPRLLRDRSVLRRLAKVMAGRRAVEVVKHVLRQD